MHRTPKFMSLPRKLDRAIGEMIRDGSVNAIVARYR